MLDTEKIIFLLKDKNISQYKFSKEIGISTGHLSNIFQKKILEPSFSLVCAMSDFLEVPIEELRLIKSNEKSFTDKKDYRLIYSQKYMGKILRDVIIKYGKTVAEMEESINALYSDPCVFEAWYEEINNEC